MHINELQIMAFHCPSPSIRIRVTHCIAFIGIALFCVKKLHFVCI